MHEAPSYLFTNPHIYMRKFTHVHNYLSQKCIVILITLTSKKPYYMYAMCDCNYFLWCYITSIMNTLNCAVKLMHFHMANEFANEYCILVL